MIMIFFFQAEDGIRDRNVTGVQTCALPISCCASLDRQDYEGELRVWVVDDGSRRNREQLLGVLERYAVAEEVHLDPETTEVRVTEPAHRPGGRAGPATRHRWTVL